MYFCDEDLDAELAQEMEKFKLDCELKRELEKIELSNDINHALRQLEEKDKIIAIRALDIKRYPILKDILRKEELAILKSNYFDQIIKGHPYEPVSMLLFYQAQKSNAIQDIMRTIRN